MTTWTIYLLRDPRDPRVGYVGQTRHTAEQRLRSHINNARRHATRAINLWLAEMIAAGVLPTIDVLEHCDSADSANDAERRWVAAQRDAGLSLANSTAGGQSLYGPLHAARVREALARPDVKARHTAQNKRIGRETWDNPEIAERRRAGVREDWARPERQEAARASWADPDRRVERGEAISAAHARPEVRARQSAASKAKANRPEQKRIVSATLKAQWADPEKRAARGAAISAALKRKWESDPEYRARQSARLAENSRRIAERHHQRQQ